MEPKLPPSKEKIYQWLGQLHIVAHHMNNIQASTSLFTDEPVWGEPFYEAHDILDALFTDIASFVGGDKNILDKRE